MISDYEQGQIEMRNRIARDLRNHAAEQSSLVGEWFLRQAELIEGYLPQRPFRQRLRELLGMAEYGNT
jgi:hypothetical protein